MLVNLFFSFLNPAPSLIFPKISVLHSFQGTFSAFWFVWFCLYISHLRLYSSIWLSLIICSYLRVGDKKSDQKLWDFPISGFILWHYIRASLGGTCIISILRISLMGWLVCPDKNPPSASWRVQTWLLGCWGMPGCADIPSVPCSQQCLASVSPSTSAEQTWSLLPPCPALPHTSHRGVVKQ